MAGKGKPGPNKGQGGRPKKLLTDEQIRVYEGAASFGMHQERIADLLGISDRTLRRRIAEDPELMTIHKKSMAVLELRLSRRVIAKATGIRVDLAEGETEGDNACLFFTLKTRFGWRETNRVEVTAPVDEASGLAGLTILEAAAELVKRTNESFKPPAGNDG